MTVETSIIVPVHNQAALTRRCLDQLLADLPATCELVVVDDASTDSTRDLLTDYGESIRALSLSVNRGYSTACNEGADAAEGELLVFLNNDTRPHPGWLQALLEYARANPLGAVVGAKLLYPNGAVQHAGVVFGQDGYPHNLYAGMPADLPAVNRSRRLQAVTGACALVRRDAFEEVGGFDPGFRNSLEDVDLCLRIGAREGEVHYCHRSVVEHLESASRGREDTFETSVSLYRRRWRDRVRRDDLEIYARDGLLNAEYPDNYPIRLSISPSLAIVDPAREPEVERQLETYAHQVSDLLQEVVRLTVAVAGRLDGAGVGDARDPDRAQVGVPVDHSEFLSRARSLEEEIRRLQELLEANGPDGFSASPRLGYRHLVEQVRGVVREEVPPGATVLVVSRGDRELVRLDERVGWHFPRDHAGEYLGHHPHDSDEAIERLEALRTEGADYLLFPSSAHWWLEHYTGFARHLHSRYPRLECGPCTIYRLDVETGSGQAGESGDGG